MSAGLCECGHLAKWHSGPHPKGSLREGDRLSCYVASCDCERRPMRVDDPEKAVD